MIPNPTARMQSTHQPNPEIARKSQQPCRDNYSE
jgi:hypothetical protein